MEPSYWVESKEMQSLVNKPWGGRKHVNYGKFQIIEHYSTFEAKVICLAKNGHMGMSKSLTYGSAVNPHI